jgi:hypothetical protein
VAQARWGVSAALAALLCGPARGASPVEFGLAEVRAAVEARSLPAKRFALSAELSMVLPLEAFQIQSNIVRGGSPRALMYGLLAAAEQIREPGRLSQVSMEPALALRGVRRLMSEADWLRPEAEWRVWLQRLARGRFNRVRLDLEDPLTPERLEALRRFCDAASDYAIDVALGIDTVDPPVLARALVLCPAVKAVFVPVAEAGRAGDVVGTAGRLVALETTEPVPSPQHQPVRIQARYVPGARRPCAEPCVFYWDLRPDSQPLDPGELAKALGAGGALGYELLYPFDRRWEQLGFDAPASAVKRAPAAKPSTKKAPAKKKTTPAARKKR